MTQKFKLRYYQYDAVKNFFIYVGENHGKYPIIVLPTGSGKSAVQAAIVQKMLNWNNTRILLLTHQKELIKQNYNELIENFNNDLFIDAGIYSAGLKRRDTHNRILFAGIQSVYKKAWELGFFDLILIDECHLISNDNEGMYRTFLWEMIKINSKIVIGGLSATPFRLKHGLLTEGKGALFSAICHETTIRELIDPNHFKNRDKKQYLCNIKSKNAINKVDLSEVHIRAGEYIPSEMEQAYMKNDLVSRAVSEIKNLTIDRKKILIFCAGIIHAEEVTEKLNMIGLIAKCIHSKKSDEENNKNIEDFKSGKFNYLCNRDILTTGFNEKAIDCIVLLRSTKSPVLLLQMIGRGFRLHPDKENCLILDFGGNIERHGPIDKIEIRLKKNGSGKEISICPQKECPQCQSLIPLAIRQCPDCGYKFPESEKHEDKASEADVLSKWKPPQTYDVESVMYSRHEKLGKPDSMRVDYYINMFDKFTEYICLEHGDFATRKALQWMRKHSPEIFKTVNEALICKELYRKVKQIIVNENDKFPRIIGYIFETEEELKKRKKIEKEKEDKKIDERLRALI